ncbi:FG-GAP-like repeat-containing protein [Streptomyces phaeochromogenes]|uniref:FG-GAP-like repeat-containing protein n=1 Tax=Streptomyces phaeochromogenes TaxID=1923 RepID=UPI003717D141
MLVSVLPATEPPNSQKGATEALPPGGLVDSAPNFGWTPGEFSVSHDGAAQYTVPLWVPAGRGVVAPQVSLSYNSRAGNGLLGVGWSLGGLSSISWCGRTISQDGYTDGGHFDGTDALCLDGNRLIPVSPQWAPLREYRTERETYSRIVAYETQDNVPNYFRVFTKDGKILSFGRSSSARVQPYKLMGSNLAEPSLVRVPGAPRVTSAWALDRVEDRNGNAATVEYTRIEGNAAGLWWTELRPRRIRYAPNRRVEFLYEGTRPDKIDGFVGGTHTRTAARMSRIEMWGGPDGGTAELLRRYRIGYQSNSITRRSLLRSLTECDSDDRCKVSVPFEYSLGSYSFEEIDVGVSDPAQVSVVDVNGDGRSDLLLDDSGRRALRIATRFAAGDSFTSPKPSGLPAASALQTLDVDADGRPEVLAEVFDSEHGRRGYRYQLYRPTISPTAGSSFEAVPGKLGEWRPSASSRQPVYLADLDGSGLPDFVGTTFEAKKPWSYRLNTGASGAIRFAPKVETSIRRNSAFGNYAVDTNGDGRTELIGKSFGGPGWVSWGLNASGGVQVQLVNLRGGPTTTHFGDVNGDGLVDSVLPHRLDANRRDQLRVQLNSGNGFGSRFTTSSPPGYREPRFPASQVDSGVRVADFNGDGRDDVLVFHSGKPNPGDTGRGLQVYLWKDNAFVRAPLDLNIGSPLGIFWDNTQILDLNGDGALDLVNVGTDGRLRGFKRLGGVPDRLIGIGDVSSRGRTEVGYTTLADRTVHTPGTISCAYPLTCPIGGGSVVASHRSTSDIGTGAELTWDGYRHTYKEARADLHGRGWLGFAEHTVTRVTTGATTVTEFANAARDPDTQAYPFAHLPRKETYTVRNGNDTTGREFRNTTLNGYEIRRLGSGTYAVDQRTATAAEQERPIGANNWQSLRHTTTATSYDDFGNPDVVRTATATGRTRTEDLDYRNDTTAWLIGLPTRSLTTGCTSAGVCTTRESAFDYDDKGNQTSTVVEPNKPGVKLTTTAGYGEFGVVKSITRTDNAGRSRTETREYNNADQLYPTATINAAGHRTLIDTHSGLGVPVSTTDPNGVKTTFRYDRFGRLRETNRSDGSFERISHSSIDGRQLTTTTVAGGGKTAELVDQLGRLRERRVTQFDGRISTTYTDHDPLGRGIRRTSRATLPGEVPQYTVTRYDHRGRVTSVTEPDGAQVRQEYVNRETHSFDAKGVHSYAVDTVDGAVDSRYEDDPESTNWLRTRFEYGPFGEITKTVAPDETTQTIHHDPLGRPDRVEDPSSGTTQTAYNAFGEIARITDADNRITRLVYDSLGRVRKRASPDGLATNTWDKAAHGLGKLAKSRSASGVTTGYTYDELGRAATTTWTVEGTRYQFRYGYDAVGRLVCITYPAISGAVGAGGADRLTVGHVYNPHGYLSQAKHGCESGGEVYWTAEARNSAGQSERERLGNGVVTTRVYRPVTGLLDRIVTSGPGASGKVGEIAYAYDANRNVTRRSDLVHQRVETYRYDAIKRLIGWSIQNAGPGQPRVNATYAYDSVGNLKAETIQSPNEPITSTTYRYGGDGAPPHALTSRNNQRYGYNRTGQQTSGPQRTVQYNTSGLPTVIDWDTGQGQARRTEFAYDPDGARVVKRDGGQETVTVAGLFERRTRAGAGDNETHNLHNIVVDGRVVAQINRVQLASGGPATETRLWYLHPDQQGSTTLTSRGSAPLAVHYYDPFGQRVDETGTPLGGGTRDGSRIGYTGHEHDDEYGLINMKGRIYDPKAKRFLTPDPIHEPGSSQSHNRYSYVQNNPATLTDPTGYVPNPPAYHKDPRRDQAKAQAATCHATPHVCEMKSFSKTAPEKGFNETPATQDAQPTPSSDDDKARSAVEISEQSAVFRGDGPGAGSSTESEPVGEQTKEIVTQAGSLALDIVEVVAKNLDIKVLAKMQSKVINIHGVNEGLVAAINAKSSAEAAQGIGDAFLSVVQVAAGLIPLIPGPIGWAAAAASATKVIPGGNDSYGDPTSLQGRAGDQLVNDVHLALTLFGGGLKPDMPRNGGAFAAQASLRAWVREVNEVMRYMPR